MKNIHTFYTYCPIPRADDEYLGLEAVHPSVENWLVCSIYKTTRGYVTTHEHAYAKQYEAFERAGVPLTDLYQIRDTRFNRTITYLLVDPKHEERVRAEAYASFLCDSERSCLWYEYVINLVWETWEALPILQKKKIARQWRWFDYVDISELPTQAAFDGGDEESHVNLLDLFNVIPEGLPDTEKQHALYWQVREIKR